MPDYLAARHATFPPEYVFAYSNQAIDLLGVVVERVSGVGFEEYVTREILEPLGMGSRDCRRGAAGGPPRILGADTLAAMLTPQNGHVPLDLGFEIGLNWLLTRTALAYAGRVARPLQLGELRSGRRGAGRRTAP